ncbi:hypothetical protein B0H14DRAFT_3443867 [Mycena olivaceomarginata]|nr:hypothetical protein B0H14DRAFT_3443867 [Mycena olivaceomarginata]
MDEKLPPVLAPECAPATLAHTAPPSAICGPCTKRDPPTQIGLHICICCNTVPSLEYALLPAPASCSLASPFYLCLAGLSHSIKLYSQVRLPAAGCARSHGACAWALPPRRPLAPSPQGCPGCPPSRARWLPTAPPARVPRADSPLHRPLVPARTCTLPAALPAALACPRPMRWLPAALPAFPSSACALPAAPPARPRSRLHPTRCAARRPCSRAPHALAPRCSARSPPLALAPFPTRRSPARPLALPQPLRRPPAHPARAHALAPRCVTSAVLYPRAFGCVSCDASLDTFSTVALLATIK